jgi:hypothetical protein
MKPLLKRNKTIEVYEMEQGRMLLFATLCDEVHEMDVKIIVDGATGTILSAEASMKRCPYPEVCPSALELVPSLAGLTLSGGAGRRVRELLDGGSGCEHLKDMVLDALRGYIPAIGYQTIRTLTEQYRAQDLLEEEIKKRVMEDLERLGQDVVLGKCVVYNKKNKILND